MPTRSVTCLILAMLCLCLPLCTAVVESTQSRSFAKAYEQLNGHYAFDGVIPYAPVSIPDDGLFVSTTAEQITSMFAQDTFVLYVGFPECPWCRALVPTLYAAARNAALASVFCYDLSLERDTKVLADDGAIITESEASPLYTFLLDALSDHIGPYEGLNDPTIQRIYFPTVIFVREGEVVSVHEGTVDSHVDGNAPLTEADQAALVETLTKQIQAIMD